MKQADPKSGIVIHACNPYSEEADTGEWLWVWGLLKLRRVLQAILGHRVDTARTTWCMWWQRYYCFTHEHTPEHKQCVGYMRKHFYPFFLITPAQPAQRAADRALGHSYDKCSCWWGSGTQEARLRNARWYIWRASFQSIIKICRYIFVFAFSLESRADRINRIQMPA